MENVRKQDLENVKQISTKNILNSSQYFKNSKKKYRNNKPRFSNGKNASKDILIKSRKNS